MAIGCGLTMLAIAIVGGAIGLIVFGYQRFGGRGDDVASVTDDPDAPDDPNAPDPIGAQPRTPTTNVAPTDAVADMRSRYVAGPHVRVEGMIPSPAAIGATGPLADWARGRSGDSPWIVLGASWEPGTPPAVSSNPAPRAESAPGEALDRPVTILAGVPVELRVRAADSRGGFEVTSYAVAFDGYRGHFLLPATVPTELGPVSASGSDGAAVRFAIGAAARPDGTLLGANDTPLPVVARIAAIDSDGRVSPWVVRQLSVVPVGTGDVEVALAMTESTDLDLYVTDPTSSTIYYANTSGPTGGHLDLDANAGCGSNMGVNAEHVFWPQGRAPRGSYTVRVANFESCIQGRPVDYRVTVRACGETVVLSGRFVGDGDSATCLNTDGDATKCQDVVRFVVPACAANSN